ncbi:lipoprotein [Spiroplasma ixodetis]|uniref:lipoprotein n=1 Tax=Spiroplasma ixodetis TaxID=2141 RepID=UPI0025789CE3|nr:lipoprotein [Spiroplasma ixodetis]WJG69227.1 hypothetical protein SIXOD_v1c00500 [Spiroplasma ixodetis Y32]
MKKLLSILSAITLIGTTSTNIIACGDGEKPTPPTPDTRTDLNTIIKTKSLGKIVMTGSIPTKEELLKSIKDNNSSANSLTISDFNFKQGSPTSTNSIIIGQNNYKGETTLTYTKDTRTDLNTIIKTKSLGKIVMTGSIPTKEELLKSIKDNNSSANSLTISDFNFKQGSPTSTNSIIIGQNNYKGETTLTYTKDTRTDLNTIIKTKSLGKIVMTGSIPTKEELLKSIKDNNSSANSLTISDFNFKQGSPTSTNSIIIGQNNYKGETTLTYTKDTRTDLNTITQLTELDITADNTKKYNDLWTEILKAKEFKNLTYNSYKTFMYKTNDLKDTADIKELNQEAGDIYIILQVGKNEGINCFGDTPRLKVTLK